MGSWLFKLQPASFRGVPFKVSDDEATFGRRATTHEYPLRDVPFTQDMGRKARRYSVSAYLVGNDYMAQRDRLLTALEQGGSATLIHPFYGSVTVNVDGEIKVQHSRDNGGMCTISLQFVESGQLNYPTAGGATAQNVQAAADKADQSFADKFLDDFDLTGPDWISDETIQAASDMLDEVIGVFEVVDSQISDAARLLQGDLSVLFPPPSKGAEIISRVQEMWAAGTSIYYNTDSALSAVDNLKSVAGFTSLAPRGVWPTLSDTAKQATRAINAFSQLMRSSAVTQSTRQFSDLPTPTRRITNNSSTHAALTETPTQQAAATVLPASYDQLTRQNVSYSQLFDKETCRVVGDDPFVRLEDLRQAVWLDIQKRLQLSAKMVSRTPDDVTPAVVLAATWYDDAGRSAEIVALNNIPHPGFVPPNQLRVASE
ncbi:DNA circularization protein [Enterobacter kobei]|uniref:DNA circularization protein n=1 Tax=Enterobacter kobei TaxID=208224 RepID=UPI00079B1802|nr:DNA circularization N-terminal domain-containing protein [Enterobacter kobei]SAF46690.1 DNA circulation family protein [Enterobacter kobei]